MTYSVGWVGVYEYYRGGNTARQRTVELYVVYSLSEVRPVYYSSAHLRDAFYGYVIGDVTH